MFFDDEEFRSLAPTKKKLQALFLILPSVFIPVDH